MPDAHLQGTETIEVGHANKTAVKAVQELDGEAAELIYELYFEDFTHFGYDEDSWQNHQLVRLCGPHPPPPAPASHASAPIVALPASASRTCTCIRSW